MADEEQIKLQDSVEAMVSKHRNDQDNLDHGVVTDWILVACTEGFDEDGPTSVYYTMYANGALADHKALGLLEAGKAFIQKEMLA